MSHAETLIRQILSEADIEINGSRPWDIQVHEPAFYSRVLSQGSLGLGESYMDGWWDCAQMDEAITRLLAIDARKKIPMNWPTIRAAALAKLMNLQSTARAFEIGEAHYDIGNDLYELMLDPRMVYTCGYWKDAKTLAEAQEAKLDLVCRKIGLKKDQTVLDIGCGWGSFMKFAAEKYGAKATGVTGSKEQIALGQKKCEGLPVEFRLEDYRDTKGTYDHVISLGMFEHVGVKNYRAYMEVARRNLADNGLFLLHTIGGLRSVTNTDPWIAKYIFPNSVLPSLKQIAEAAEGLFVIEDVHNFSADYEKTLMAWYANVEANWDKLKDKYNDRFHRMWRFYLLSCAATFRTRQNQLWQIILSKKGVPGGYTSVR